MATIQEGKQASKKLPVRSGFRGLGFGVESLRVRWVRAREACWLLCGVGFVAEFEVP